LNPEEGKILIIANIAPKYKEIKKIVNGTKKLEDKI
jgi:hypothetical protein